MTGAKLHPKSAYSNVPPKIARRDTIAVSIALGLCLAAPYCEPSTEKLSAESAATTFVRTPETSAIYPAPSHEVRP